jgi:hypothetical protein
MAPGPHHEASPFSAAARNPRCNDSPASRLLEAQQLTGVEDTPTRPRPAYIRMEVLMATHKLRMMIMKRIDLYDDLAKLVKDQLDE